SLVISKLTDENKELTQRYAIMAWQAREIGNRLEVQFASELQHRAQTNTTGAGLDENDREVAAAGDGRAVADAVMSAPIRPAIIQPVVNMVIFTVIFGRVAHLPSDGVPYAVFTLTALLPWTYFSYVLMQSGESLVANGTMISKVYFPRLVLPVSAALAGLVDF